MIKRVALALLLGVLSLTGCSNRVKGYDLSTELGTASYLLDITRANFAPYSQEEYEEAYKRSKAVLGEELREKFFDYENKKGNLVTSVLVMDSDVVYSSKSTKGDSVYRVTLELKATGETQKVDTLFYCNNEGEIVDILIVKGGVPRV